MSILLFVLGLALGSFINVLVFRLNTGETIARGRSRCLSCLEQLRWYDLIPLLSYTIIWGRCRYCKTQLSVQYPLVELFAACIVVSVGFTVSPLDMPLRFLVISGFFLTLLAASVYDLRHLIIPDQLSLTLLFFVILFEGIQFSSVSGLGIAYDLLAGVGAFLFFGGLWFVSNGAWMGFGDAKLAFSLGIFLGYPEIIIAIVLAFWLGAGWGIMLLLRRVATRKTEIPFGPFLALGTFITFLMHVLPGFAAYYSYVTVI